MKHPDAKVIRRTSKVKAHDEAGNRRHRRPRPADGDPAAVRHQAVAPESRSWREGQVTHQSAPERSGAHEPECVAPAAEYGQTSARSGEPSGECTSQRLGLT